MTCKCCASYSDKEVQTESFDTQQVRIVSASEGDIEEVVQPLNQQQEALLAELSDNDDSPADDSETEDSAQEESEYALKGPVQETTSSSSQTSSGDWDSDAAEQGPLTPETQELWDDISKVIEETLEGGDWPAGRAADIEWTSSSESESGSGDEGDDEDDDEEEQEEEREEDSTFPSGVSIAISSPCIHDLENFGVDVPPEANNVEVKSNASSVKTPVESHPYYPTTSSEEEEAPEEAEEYEEEAPAPVCSDDSNWNDLCSQTDLPPPSPFIAYHSIPFRPDRVYSPPQVLDEAEQAESSDSEESESASSAFDSDSQEEEDSNGQDTVQVEVATKKDAAQGFKRKREANERGINRDNMIDYKRGRYDE